MGCLNSGQGFGHWFGNIHLSGPCNRSCYFCIGQHMMDLDRFNVLNAWPLPGIDRFFAECRSRGVKQVYLTGTNTDPLLYRRTSDLSQAVRAALGQDVSFGIRTNAVRWRQDIVRFFDKGSVTVCSLNPEIYAAMMGQGKPPDVAAIVNDANWFWGGDLKINVVLGPENAGNDLHETLDALARLGIRRVNLREPYGQPRVGDPLGRELLPSSWTLGCPTYTWRETMEVTYWDVHYCHVESVNLYASGRVSLDYPITQGHSDDGIVLDQSNFNHGRHQTQWLEY